MGTFVYSWWDLYVGTATGKRYGRFPPKLKIELMDDPAVPLLEICPKEKKH